MNEMQIGRRLLASFLFGAISSGAVWAAEPIHVGRDDGGAVIVPTRQVLNPAGKSVEFHGRPVDLALSRDGKTLFVKSDSSLFVIDPREGKIRQEIKYPGKLGASMHGIAISPDGSRLYITLAQSVLGEYRIETDGAISAGRMWQVRVKKEGESYPNGIAISRDGKMACICLSCNNSLALFEIQSGRVIANIPVGVAPYDVVISPDEKIAYVSDWGGRRATAGDKTARSAGTPVVVDARGIAQSGCVSMIELSAHKEIAQVATGLHPSGLVLTKDGRRLFVANANSDTVCVIDTGSQSVTQTLDVRPDRALPFGSAPNALALSEDEQTLFVANGGNNAIAMIDLETPAKQPDFLPTAWYPGSLALRGQTLFIANIKGLGALDPTQAGKLSTRLGQWGSINYLAVPTDRAALDIYSKQVRADALVNQSLAAFDRPDRNRPSVPVPLHAGEPSLFKHAIYIIKENRTYDQVLGDVGKGNSDPNLCIYGRDVTPNQHALAEQFVLLDNYYCNGALSPDGHHWATEGYAVDYLEKSFGAWVRSYASTGDDPLAYSNSGFIWDNALAHGVSFRNYGEFRYDKFEPFAHGGAERNGLLIPPPSTQGTFKPHLGLAAIAPYTCPDFPGFATEIFDIQRADIFIRELHDFEKSGKLPGLIIIYLPNNHTNGLKPGSHSPAAMVADNDLAVGKIIDALSHGPYWKDSCVFVTEDDPQDGFDHVDGHRSPCLLVSAYTKRKAIVSDFYNQTSVLHTIELMLGLPPMNQLDSLSPPMRECFTSRADFAPFNALANVIPLDEMNPSKAAVSGEALKMAELSDSLELDEADEADENTLNRILWFAAKPNVPYPAMFAGSRQATKPGTRFFDSDGIDAAGQAR